jgi:hypothetical protein
VCAIYPQANPAKVTSRRPSKQNYTESYGYVKAVGDILSGKSAQKILTEETARDSGTVSCYNPSGFS